ncbi:ABC transporter ATP-binding protein [Brumicola nitratireducens]|uniref:ABC transporter, nucleotide binding/ATPase protein n=1 Tax=Glaciecola nitratireducens (strain JCM 12485 / KCTC 12276 / FR1064) TaxID=1085623 RepID=G4QK13_GLANF|nr:ABC transporter ATP-binding protein [Glaciecola nitratireducens]AEP29135.1 ABC transporter, nucleotide binding/ATPase protein [Glaciecola nitratireducens FR1064]
MLSLKNLQKSYIDAGEKHTILNNVNLSIMPGDSISIQGASGSGKSTLLHLLAALDKPDSGEILLTSSGESCGTNNKRPNDPQTLSHDITQFTEKQADQYRQFKVGLIFQRFNLIDCITVMENIMLPAKITGNVQHEYIRNLLNALGIDRHINKLPNQLSGGEQQRVAIARGLSHQPPLLLADEPTGNLDGKNSDTVSKLLVDTCKKLNTSLVMVTHSEKVASLTQQQWYLNDGRLSQI